MRMRISFTVDVPATSLPKLRELGQVDTNTDAKWFLTDEARDHVITYMNDNGIPAVPINSD